MIQQCSEFGVGLLLLPLLATAYSSLELHFVRVQN